MDPIEFFGAYAVWLFSFLAGGVTMLGVATIITGRMMFGLGYQDWSSREARQLGTISLVVGLVYGLYALCGDVILATKTFPGQGWWILLAYIPGLGFTVGLSLAAAIVGRHRKLAKQKSPRRPSSTGCDL